uniref:Uncharacterized protein n=1 Tax=Timema douglasi TaxID=61478 RepID=A0A7R8Z7V7_TIMDO|nr:unnamed protein product [Timema douglasi]
MGLMPKIRRLRKGVVPSIFPWKKPDKDAPIEGFSIARQSMQAITNITDNDSCSVKSEPVWYKKEAISIVEMDLYTRADELLKEEAHQPPEAKGGSREDIVRRGQQGEVFYRCVRDHYGEDIVRRGQQGEGILQCNGCQQLELKGQDEGEWQVSYQNKTQCYQAFLNFIFVVLSFVIHSAWPPTGLVHEANRVRRTIHSLSRDKSTPTPSDS